MDCHRHLVHHSWVDLGFSVQGSKLQQGSTYSYSTTYWAAYPQTLNPKPSTLNPKSEYSRRANISVKDLGLASQRLFSWLRVLPAISCCFLILSLFISIFPALFMFLCSDLHSFLLSWLLSFLSLSKRISGSKSDESYRTRIATLTPHDPCDCPHLASVLFPIKLHYP